MTDSENLPRPKYVKFEREWRDGAKKDLPKAQQCKLAAAIVDYILDGIEPELPREAMIAFNALRSSLDFRRNKAIEQLLRNQGTKSDEVSKALANPSDGLQEIVPRNSGEKNILTCGDDVNHRSVSASSSINRCTPIEIDKDIKISSSRFDGFGAASEAGPCIEGSAETRVDRLRLYPTRREVSAYCEACGLVVSPDKFFDYYEARGWLDKGGRPIADWRAKLRFWNANEGNYPEKRAASGVDMNDGSYRHPKMMQIGGNDKEAGMWVVAVTPQDTRLVPGSKGLSRDEAEELAAELIPGLCRMASSDQRG